MEVVLPWRASTALSGVWWRPTRPSLEIRKQEVVGAGGVRATITAEPWQTFHHRFLVALRISTGRSSPFSDMWLHTGVPTFGWLSWKVSHFWLGYLSTKLCGNLCATFGDITPPDQKQVTQMSPRGEAKWGISDEFNSLSNSLTSTLCWRLEIAVLSEAVVPAKRLDRKSIRGAHVEDTGVATCSD